MISLIQMRYLEFQTNSGDMVDITNRVTQSLSESGLRSGLATIFVPGATGAVTTIENEIGLKEDMKAALERWAPGNIRYAHDERWHDGNGHSHIRASLIGPSLTLPFSDGKLTLGIWQQIVFLEMDNRPRQRKIVVQIMGET
ncbi:MAG: secondary thiamine-phosphate synthase enzyme YjbQ [Methanotrichaceae archaeon]|nr:secondary thiamine-phosphate synthase enzyme YjbQ [Methanotrichaceae archaeon]